MMIDELDTEVWIGIFALTAVLYLFKYIQGRGNKQTVYRVSPKSLEKSKTVMMSVLPLVEDDDEESIIDKRRLRYSKEDVKSAAKILTYYYWKQKQPEELARVENGFIALCRFQDTNDGMEEQVRKMGRERASNTRELQHYLSCAPFNAKRGK